MSACCPYTVLNFAGVDTSIFPYTAAMKISYGAKPKVDVFYFNSEDNSFTNNNGIPVSEVKFDGDYIYINHGGPASGYVKIN